MGKYGKNSPATSHIPDELLNEAETEIQEVDEADVEGVIEDVVDVSEGPLEDLATLLPEAPSTEQVNSPRYSLVTQAWSDFAKLTAPNVQYNDKMANQTLRLSQSLTAMANLTPGELKDALDEIIEIVSANLELAFSPVYSMRFIEQVKTPERERLIRFFTLVRAYAKCEDKSKIGKFCNIDYALEPFKGTGSMHGMIGAYFRGNRR